MDVFAFLKTPLSADPDLGERARREAANALTNAARRAAGAVVARQAGVAIFRLAASIALARILLPDEFGVAAMAVAFAALPQAFADLGLGAYLIQADRADVKLYGQVYILNLIVSLILAAAVVMLGAFAPVFYGDERVRPVVWATALTIPARALWAVHEKVLRRNLQFHYLAIFQSAEHFIVSLVAVTLAALGFSYWSLVIPGIVVNFLIAPFYWHASGLPGIPGRVRQLKKSIRLYRFSAYSTFNAVLTYVGNNADYLLIGRMLDSVSMGLYTFAYSKAFLFSKKLLSVVADVALPIMSVAKQQPVRLKRALIKSLTLLSLFNVPLAIFLGIAAPVFVPWVFGPHWIDAVGPFQILLVHVVVNAVTSPAGSVAYAIGRPELNFWIAAPTAPVLVAAYYIGIKVAGVTGVAVAIAVVKSIASFAKLYLLLRALQWNFSEFAGKPLRIFLLGGISGLLTFGTAKLFSSLPPFLDLTSKFFIFFITYLTLMLFFDRHTIVLALETALPEHLRAKSGVSRINTFLSKQM